MKMINIKMNYYAVQFISISLGTLAYLFIRNTFQENGERNFLHTLSNFAVILSVGYVFFTNRIFYAVIKDVHYDKDTS